MRSLSGVAVLLLCFAPVGIASAQQQYSSANIEAGYRIYTTQCALCHGANGDGIAGVNLARQQFRRAQSDADIRDTIGTGVPAAGMPPFQFRPAEVDAIIAWIRSGFDLTGASFTVGDAARGKVVYDRSGCAACHRVHGVGSRVAPDLTDIGVTRKAAAIQSSILQPTPAMQPINRPAHIVTRDGRMIDGRRLNEDTASVQLIDRNERLISIQKSDIQQYQLGSTSEMPSYAGKFSTAELADLLGYLLSLRG